MLAGDAAGSWQVVEAAMASGVEPADVYVEILAPALHGIGSGWQAGTIPIEREHLASSVAAAIVGRMGPRFRRRGRHLGSVIIAMPVGERHGLGVAMLADIVRRRGLRGPQRGPRHAARVARRRPSGRATTSVRSSSASWMRPACRPGRGSSRRPGAPTARCRSSPVGSRSRITRRPRESAPTRGPQTRAGCPR